uniref:PsbP C-terminal domain-containing protein n=2 Tax=Aegilops tauschii subsp. strangulata TaxID=200361 RepID=A0A453GZC4_AEGTS
VWGDPTEGAHASRRMDGWPLRDWKKKKIGKSRAEQRSPSARTAMATATSLSLHGHGLGLPSPTAKTPARRLLSVTVRAMAPASPSKGDAAAGESSPSPRRQVLVAGAAVAAAALVSRPAPAALAAADGKFMPVIDRKAGYSFVYPFGWQVRTLHPVKNHATLTPLILCSAPCACCIHLVMLNVIEQEVSVQGQDKVYKDVIEPLESVSINMIPTTKEDIRDLGPPDQVAEALVRKVLSPPTQKTKLIEAKETDIDGRAYYTFEFTAQAPNFTRHALGTITIANGKFYTLATGANERRWDKMKDRLHTIVDSFKIETKV